MGETTIGDPARVKTVYETNVRGKILGLDGEKSNLDTKDDHKTKKRIRVRKRKVMSRSERKKLDTISDKKAKSSEKFDDFADLHLLWKSYILDYLGPNTSAHNAPGRLVKADFHGALFTVTQASCPNLVGQTGIVLQETMNTFKIITSKDEIKVIPKHRTRFAV